MSDIHTGFVSKSLSRAGGGIFESMRAMAKALDHNGLAKVSVFGLEDEHAEQDKRQWQPLESSTFPVLGPNALGYAPELLSALNHSDINLIHSHGLWSYTSSAVLQWRTNSKLPYLISPHGMLDPWAVNNSRWKKHIASWLYESKHLAQANCLHALCEEEADAIRKYSLNNPICVIPNGVDLPDPSANQPCPEWKSKLPRQAKILFYLGRLHPKKGLLNLIQAWAEVAQNSNQFEPWYLVIAGWSQGGHEQELKAAAQELGMEDKIHFIGPQSGDYKAASYQHSDAFILPSFSEGLPMTVLEAWSYGLPVLMTPACNLPEGFQSNSALLIEPNQQSITEGLLTFLEMHDNDRQSMGQAGLELVKQKFTWPKVAADFSEVYATLLETGSLP